MTAEELEAKSARRRARYKSMTEEQRQKRREYQKAWMRKHRAAAKASHTPQVAPDPPTVQTPAPAAKAATAPIAEREKIKKPKGAIAQHRSWRTEVVTFFEDMLTDPRCPLSGQDFSTNRTYGFFFGIFDRLNQIENIADNTDQLAELRLSVAIECLRRLSGETPAGTAPALPGIAQKSA
jgi:hypothetical protein